MPSHSSKQMAFFKSVKAAKHNPSAPAHLKKIANTMNDSDIDDFANSVAELKTKKAMLSILKDIKEPMYLNEDEEQDSIDPIANTFKVKEEWAIYIKPYIGQPLSVKELEAVESFKEKQPSTTARTEIWYKTTDTFSISHTTVIKKMRDSGQFSFTAFQKQERPLPDEKEPSSMSAGNVENPMDSNSPEIPQDGTQPTPEVPEDKENDKEDIIVTKSILFKDDIKGAAILIEFLKKLDL